MTDAGGMRTLSVTFLIVAGYVAWQEVKAGHVPPSPVRFVDVGLTYAILGIVSSASAPLAAVFGIGLAIALIMRHNPNNDPNKTNPLPPPGGIKPDPFQMPGLGQSKPAPSQGTITTPGAAQPAGRPGGGSGKIF